VSRVKARVKLLGIHNIAVVAIMVRQQHANRAPTRNFLRVRVHALIVMLMMMELALSLVLLLIIPSLFAPHPPQGNFRE
jgi:hypothetical protein